MPTDVRAESRRNFLRFLAESPLLLGVGSTLAAGAARAQDDAVLSGALDFDDVIKSAADAVNVWDFETAVRTKLNAGHYAYVAQGSDEAGRTIFLEDLCRLGGHLPIGLLVASRDRHHVTVGIT